MSQSGSAAALSSEGARRFAGWDADLFAAFVGGPAQILAERLKGQEDAGPVLAGYLRLGQQAVGLAALRRVSAGGAWTSFLEYCLVELIPNRLPEVPAGRRLPLLVNVWNLAEGLRREPAWLDRYVTASAGRLRDLARLEEFLVRTLDPVLAPLPPSGWQGPFRAVVLDLRPVYDRFLPGEVSLAAPTVLRVADRRGDLQIGVLLRHGGKSEVLGLTNGLEDYPEGGDRPAVEFGDGQALIAGKAVPLPALRRCHRHAVARAGFVAACAADSQRLWIIESP